MSQWFCSTFSRACTLNTGPSWALTVFMRNMSLQMQMSPEHVPENTISSDQPYTAHIMVSVFPMLPLRPIKPPPDERKRSVKQSNHSWERQRHWKREREREREREKRSYRLCAKTSYVWHQPWWACREGRDWFWQQISCLYYHWKRIKEY